MDKAELNAKLGYNRELLNQLSNAFDLQEDYNDYGWDKLFEICRYIYNLEQQCKRQKEAIDKITEIINYYGVDKEYNDNVILRHILKDMLDILNEVSK